VLLPGRVVSLLSWPFFPPTYGSLGDIEPSKIPLGQPGCGTCLTFASGERLVDASQREDLDAVALAAKAIETGIRGSARTICEKYIH
jgi:hypothetical protein